MEKIKQLSDKFREDFGRDINEDELKILRSFMEIEEDLKQNGMNEKNIDELADKKEIKEIVKRLFILMGECPPEYRSKHK